jgi:hypothetical protein
MLGLVLYSHAALQNNPRQTGRRKEMIKGNSKWVVRFFALMFVLLLGACGPAEQVEIPVGTPLYAKGSDIASDTFSETDKTDYIADIDGSDREGYGIVYLYAGEREGAERYFKLTDVQSVLPTPGTGNTAPQEGTADTVVSNEPMVLPEAIQWIVDYVLGMWFIWVCIAASVLFSMNLYNWQRRKTTPKPLRLEFDKLATRLSAYTFGLQIDVFFTYAKQKDRYANFETLKGKNDDQKLEDAKGMLRSFVEGQIQEVTLETTPEDINAVVARWIKRFNRILKSVDWSNIEGTLLEGYPDIGVDLSRAVLVGIDPSPAMANYLASPSEARRHAQAALDLQAATPNMTLREAWDRYLVLNEADTRRDMATSVAEAAVKILESLGGPR